MCPRDLRAAPARAAAAPSRAGAPALRIVHVLSSLGMGGQERLALDLAARQTEDGHRVATISLDPRPGGPLEAEFRARGVELVHAPKRRRVDPGLAARLFGLFRNLGADLVHTHNPQPLIYAARVAARAGAAVVHTKHGENPAPTRQRWLRRRAAARARAFVAVSEGTAAVARRTRECPEARLHVLENGIDTRRFRPDPDARRSVRAELGIPKSAYVVGSVGRLFEEKGHAFLLRAVAPLLSADFCVVIVGDGPEAKPLADIARDLGPAGGARLLGPRRDVPRLLAAFDAFALPSIREGLPLVVPEAMAAGLPVVATAVGGLPKVIDHGDTGFLVPYGDETRLGARLAELAADPARAAAIGARARERALAAFSIDATAARYMTLYRAVLPQ